MKNTILWLCLPVLFLSACHDTADIGIIGGADGPTSIIVSTPGEGETVTHEEMPELDGIPVPPGIFSRAVSYPETGMIQIETWSVAKEMFDKYTEETLPLAGYPAVYSMLEYPGNAEGRVENHMSDDEKRSIQLIYTDGTLLVVITEN